MANQDDNNNQEIEKVEDVEVETTKNTSDTDNKKQNNDDGYEKVCFICRRPESVAGKMIELPNHICVCDDPRDAMLWVQEGLATAVFPRSMEDLCTYPW